MKRCWGLTLVLSIVVCLAFIAVGCGGSDETGTTVAAETGTTVAAETGTTVLAETGTTVLAETTAVSGEPIRVGVLMEKTSFLAAVGEQAIKGIELAVEQAGGAINGRPLEIVYEDAASDVNVSVDKARKLVETDDVCAIVGPVFGSAGEAIAGYLDKVNVPNVTVANASSVVALSNKHTFLASGTHQQCAYPLGFYAFKELGYKTAVSTGQDSVGGKEYLEAFKEGFELVGGEVTQQTWSPPGTTDFSSYWLGLKQADCVIGWWGGSEVISAIKQYSELGIKMPLLQPEDGAITMDPAINSELGAACAGVIAPVMYSYIADTPENKEFVAAYTAKYGVAPGPMAGCGYVSMQIALEAIKNAGGDVTGESVTKALESISMDTVRGHIAFNAEHIADFQCPLVQIDKDLKQTIVATYEVSTAKVGDKIVTTVK